MSQRLVKTNQILALVVAALVLASFYSYSDSVRRAERFERGQKFLPNLNPDEIAVITVAKGEETTRLRRDGDHFVTVSSNGYPAANDAVNRLVRDVLELSLDKKVGRGDALRDELGLAAGGEETTEVAFLDAAGKAMVRFVVGDALEGGNGNYVQRTDVEDGEIFLTSARVYLTTASDDFVNKEIVDVAQSEVARIEGADYVIEKQDDVLSLLELPAGKKEIAAKINDVKGVLTGLRFTKHHLADDQALAGLAFTDSVALTLDDGAGYRVAVGTLGDKHYLRIEGFHQADQGGQVQVSLDASEDEVRETSETLVKIDEMRAFNTFQGSWIYEVTSYVADKVRLKKSDLIEDA